MATRKRHSAGSITTGPSIELEKLEHSKEPFTLWKEDDGSFSYTDFLCVRNAAWKWYQEDLGSFFEISLPKGYDSGRASSEPEYLDANITLDFTRDCFRKGLIGIGPHILSQIVPAIYDCRDVSSPVLITGETGTGKDVVARCIHKLGKRKCRSFVDVNCSGIPETLLESELFGYVKGAFTDAKENREGKFQLADGGTIFLDEIGDMSPHLQAKILRVLNDGSIWRVGGDKEEKVDVRVIAATNKRLYQAMEDGNFRKDLFFRLNTMEIELWPLYLRPEDMPLLIYSFINEYNVKNSATIDTVFLGALRSAALNRWEGNVRELRSMVERACNLALGTGQKTLTTLVAEKIGMKGGKIPDEWHPMRMVKLPELLTLNIQQAMKAMDKFTPQEFQRPWDIRHRLDAIKRSQKTTDDPFERIADYPFAEVQYRYAVELVRQCGGNVEEAGRRGKKGASANTLRRWRDTSWASE